MQFILASKSPRRRELLSLVLPQFDCAVADVDEHSIRWQEPGNLCLELARRKSRAVFETHRNAVVIGCDTVVSVDGQILGKPRDRDDELRMLRLLSGRRHEVYTGVYVTAPDQADGFVCCTGVTFLPLTEREMAEYADSADPYDKAGGYGVQSGAAKFCSRIDGCFFNVMGLPVSALYTHLREMRLL